VNVQCSLYEGNATISQESTAKTNTLFTTKGGLKTQGRKVEPVSLSLLIKPTIIFLKSVATAAGRVPCQSLKENFLYIKEILQFAN
jgi:hypothetical protein